MDIWAFLQKCPVEQYDLFWMQRGDDRVSEATKPLGAIRVRNNAFNEI